MVRKKHFVVIIVLLAMTFGLTVQIQANAKSQKASKVIYVVTKKVTEHPERHDANGYTEHIIETSTYRYDRAGMVDSFKFKETGAQFPNNYVGNYSYNYDNKCRLVSITSPCYNLSISYNNKGRVRHYRYDYNIRVVGGGLIGENKKTNQGGDPLVDSGKPQYNSEGQIVSIPDYSGAGGMGDSDVKVRLRFVYDNGGRISEIYNYTKNLGERKQYTCYYDSYGNFLEYDKPIGYFAPQSTAELIYNNAGRLMQRVEKYKETGNLVSTTTYTYKKVKVSKYNYSAIKKQQWKIVNFDDCYGDLGLNTFW